MLRSYSGQASKRDGSYSRGSLMSSRAGFPVGFPGWLIQSTSPGSVELLVG